MSDTRNRDFSSFLNTGTRDLAASDASESPPQHHVSHHGFDDDLLSSDSNDSNDATAITAPLVNPVISQSNEHSAFNAGAVAGSDTLHSPPPAAVVGGQLWYGLEDISNSGLDHIDSDDAGHAVSDVPTTGGGANVDIGSVGLDGADGLYFIYGRDGLLRDGHIENDLETNSASELSSVNMVFGTGFNADVVNALAVDPINHIVYIAHWGQTDALTGIFEVQYNPTTGALTSPFNATSDTITDSGHVLFHDDNTGKVNGTTSFTDVTAMQYDMQNGNLYYVDESGTWAGSSTSGSAWAETNGIYVVSATGSPTPTQLTTSQFAGETNNAAYIIGLAINEAQGIIYFAVNNAGTLATKFYYMPIAGGTATQMTAPTGFGFVDADEFGGVNPLAFDSNLRQLYISDQTNHSLAQFTLSADGHSFTSGTDVFQTANPGNDGGIATSLYYDPTPSLSTLTATTTEALQGGTALNLLTSTPTISDPQDGASNKLHMAYAQVVISNAQAGDQLFLAGQQSGTVDSGKITIQWNSATHTLMFYGNETEAEYASLMAQVAYQDGGTDNSTGSHPTRTIDFIISDGTTITDQTTADANEKAVTVVIDRAPTLTADNYAVLESASSTGTSGTGGTGVLGNDTDKDADAIVITAVNGSGANVNNSVNGTYGALQLFADGHFTYSANNTSAIDAAATGSHPVDTFTYTVSDGLGGVTTTTVSFTIDRAPTVVADSGAAVESASGTGNVLTNDSDKDGDTLTVSAVNGSGAGVGNAVAGTYGSITIASNGSYTYNASNTSAIDSAATGSHLTDTFTYTTSDGHGGTTSTTVTITLDRPPTVVADAGAAVESSSGTGNVLTNDSDRDGDTLVVSAVNGSGAGVGNSVAGTYGHITIGSTGSYTYNADNTSAIDSAATGSHLTDSFTYTASDGHGGTTTATITITLDRAPTVVNDSNSAVESATVNVLAASGVLANDSDRDGDSLTVTAVGGSSLNVNNSFATTYGHITIGADGSYTYVADNTSAIDSAPTGSHAVDTISVTVGDGHGGSTNETLSITIDRAPTVVADSGAAVESASGTGNVLTNDSDKDGDTLVVSAVNGSGAGVNNSVAGTYGHITINTNGSYTYNADNTSAIDSAATGSHLTDSFTYTASDGHGGTTTTNVVITLDRAPTVVVDAGAAVEGSSGTGNVLTNDSDRDGDTLVVSAVNGSGAGVGNSVAGTYGHITIGSTGSYTYTADNTSAIDSAATGSHLTDTFSYTASDGHGGTTTTNIVITLDRAPTVVNDSNSDVENATVNVLAASGVLANDSDRDGDSLTVTAVGGSSLNVNNSFATTYGHITIGTDGSYTYVADNTSAINSAPTGSHAVDTVSITVGDGHGGSTNETLSITIDRAPTVVADAGAAVESASGSGNVLTNDSDADGDTLVVSAVNGIAGNVGNSVAGTYGEITIGANGSYTYTADNTSAIDSAATGSHLTDTFSYTASDGHGGTTTTNIVITLDRAPTVVTDNNNVTENGSVSENAANGVLANDSDRDGDSLTVTAVGGSSLNVNNSFATTYGHITLNADGSYTYLADNTSAINSAPTGSHPIDTVSFTVSDGHGGTTTETLNITVDRPAFATADSLNTTESSTATVGSGSPSNANLLANDGDPDGDSFVITAVNGSAGNVESTITLASGATLLVHQNGTYTYDPNHAFDYLASSTSGASDTTATDSFTYTITGGATVTVTITVNGQDSNDTLIGTTGNDTLTAGVGNDIVYDDNGLNSGKDPLDTSAGHSGGTDSINGGSGDDVVFMGGNLTAADHIDGSTGNDRVVLNGDYSAGLTFTATTMVNVENLGLVAGHSYDLVMDNATVTSGNTLRVQAGNFGAGDTVTFDASNDTTGGDYLINTGAGNDVLTGGAGNDRFHPGSGNDTINGNGGDDKIGMNAFLTATDQIDGGAGHDSVVLKGDYSAGVVFTDTTMVNVELIGLVKGDSYSLTMADDTVALGDTLTVRAQSLGVGDNVTFDGSADVAGGAFIINTGDGNDVLTGGNGNDVFRPGAGNDIVHGGGGDDVINMANNLNAADQLDGGSGYNVLLLDGPYGSQLTLNSNTIANIQEIDFAAGHDYNLIFNGLDVANGASLTFRAASLGSSDNLTLDGSAFGSGVTLIFNDGDGHDTLIGGGGNDIFRVGTGNDTINGGGGADLIKAGTGDDTFVYAAPSDSTSTTYDTIQGFDALNDHFQLLGYPVLAINAEVTHGVLNAATFDADLATAIGSGQLGAHDAVLYDPNRGDLHGHLFLVVDLNGVAGYQAGQDLVIDITGAANIGSLTTGNFIT
jgi:VCBS repeat-containing protein